MKPVDAKLSKYFDLDKKDKKKDLKVDGYVKISKYRNIFCETLRTKFV